MVPPISAGWQNADRFQLPLAFGGEEQHTNTLERKECDAGSDTSVEYRCQSWMPRRYWFIPPETRWMEVRLEQSGIPKQGPIAWTLTYKRPDGEASDLAPAQQESPYTDFRFKVDAEDTDGYYDINSKWRFQIYGIQPQPAPAGPKIKFLLEVWPHKDAPPADAA